MLYTLLISFFFFLMIRLPPRSTRTDTLFPTRRSSDLPGHPRAPAVRRSPHGRAYPPLPRHRGHAAAAARSAGDRARWTAFAAPQPADAADTRHRRDQRFRRQLRRLLVGVGGGGLLLRGGRAIHLQLSDQLGSREHVPHVRHAVPAVGRILPARGLDRKSTRLNSSH